MAATRCMEISSNRAHTPPMSNSDRVILRAVKNGDAPELKILMATMGLIPEEEDNIEKTA